MVHRMKYLAGTAALGAIALTATAFAAAAHRPAPTTVQSSALLFNGQVRCSVSLASPAHVGKLLHGWLQLHNLSDRPIQITQYTDDTGLSIKGSDGTTFDTQEPSYGTGGGPPGPISIGAGKTVSQRLGFRVRSSGPLRVTPRCGGTVPGTVGPTGSGQDEGDWTKLPTLHIRVARTAAPRSRRATVADVVAATGPLLDNCRPRVSGVAVDGVLYAPNGATPPMPARCSVRATRERGFYLAQELIVTPPTLKVHVGRPYGQLTWPQRAHGNWVAVSWQFVVTRGGAVPVDSFELYGEKSSKHHEAPDWTWTRSGPSDRYSEPCGGMGAISGGVSPDITWVSACRGAK